MLRVKLLDPKAIAPRRAHEDDVGFDLYACESGWVSPGARCSIPTGIAIEPPMGFYGRVAPRSGLAAQYGINIHAGVVDPSYRGEIRVVLINHGDQPWEFRRGEKIAQLVLESYYTGDLEVVTELSDTQRGTGGFGSTGL